MTSSRDAWTPLGAAAPAWSQAGTAVAGESRPWLPDFSGGARGHTDREPVTAEQRAFEAGVAAGIAEERARSEERARGAMQTLARAAEQLDAIQGEFARDRQSDDACADDDAIDLVHSQPS